MRKKMAHMDHKCVFAMILSLLLAGCSLLTPTVQTTDTQVVPTGSPERVLSTDVFSITCPEGWLTHGELFGGQVRVGHDPTFDADILMQINDAVSNSYGDKFVASCQVMVKPVLEGKTLADVASLSYVFFEQNDYPILSQAEAPFAGRQGIEVIAKRPDGPTWYQFRDLWAAHEDRAYVLSCQTHPDDFEDTLPLFEGIAESFEFK
jgi:hypothetical protein